MGSSDKAACGIAKVVVIDDDKLICEVVKKMLLATKRYEVSVFEDASKGLRHIKNSLPDVIILDIHMPGIDGVQMLSMIKSDPFISHIPVAILTGDDHEDMKDTMMASYADAYIVKPATQEKLDNALTAILNNIRHPEKVL